jgi:16S rRNA (cytosine967-C5)-methyltransferase
LRRRPESRWRREPSDVADLAGLQRELLTAALGHVRVGGVVAYVTCSPHLAETHGVVSAVLRGRKDVERIDAAQVLAHVGARDAGAGDGVTGGVADLDPGPSVQLWPHRHGTDAMFLALLRRTG